jgi:hypothetical protein
MWRQLPLTALEDIGCEALHPARGGLLQRPRLTFVNAECPKSCLEGAILP